MVKVFFFSCLKHLRIYAENNLILEIWFGITLWIKAKVQAIAF